MKVEVEPSILWGVNITLLKKQGVRKKKTARHFFKGD